DVHGALALVDRLDGAGNGFGFCRQLFDLRPSGQGKRQDQRGRGQYRRSWLHLPSPLGFANLGGLWMTLQSAPVGAHLGTTSMPGYGTLVVQACSPPPRLKSSPG